MQLHMIEEQIDEEILLADFEMILAAEKGKTDAKFEHEVFEMVQKTALEVTFVGAALSMRKSKL